MSYMRNEKGIQIEGSSQKKKLRYMGYFHGYKGYRYCHSPNSLFNYNNFRELQAVYNFEHCCEVLRKSVPINIYSRIIHTDARHKLLTLRKFL